MEAEIITVAQVKSNALRTATFDDKLLEGFILPAQRFYLKQFLGKDTYDWVVDNTADVLVSDYLVPMLSYYVVYDAFPEIRMNITSKGIMINSSETSVSASGGDAAMLRQNVLSMAERWKKLATEFLKDNKENYPNFKDGSKFNNRSLFII
jgi:hypothetical protein